MIDKIDSTKRRGRRDNMVTVDCVLTQGAWHVLRRDNPHDGTGVDITKSPWYTMVRLMLRREEVTRGGYVGMKLTDGVAGKLYVTLDDVRRLGHYISTENMAHLSCAITGREREQICEEVRMAKVFGGLPRDTAIDYFIMKHGMEEEIQYSTLRKWYQRHYANTEEGFIKDYQHIMHWKAGQKRDK